MKPIKKITTICLIALSISNLTGCDDPIQTPQVSSPVVIEIDSSFSYKDPYKLVGSKLRDPDLSEFVFTHTLLLRSIDQYAAKREFEQRVIDIIPLAISLELHGITTEHLVKNADEIADSIYERLEIFNLALQEHDKITNEQKARKIEELGTEFIGESESDELEEVVTEEKEKPNAPSEEIEELL